jgi:hypothetical protein
MVGQERAVDVSRRPFHPGLAIIGAFNKDYVLLNVHELWRIYAVVVVAPLKSSMRLLFVSCSLGRLNELLGVLLSLSDVT